MHSTHSLNSLTQLTHLCKYSKPTVIDKRQQPRGAVRSEKSIRDQDVSLARQPKEICAQ